jgi:hypothetical protein
MNENQPTTTHADLVPRGMCPLLRMKHILTHGMDEPMSMAVPRQWPGDGYYWCSKTCTAVGPDDQVVHPRDCAPGRSCYSGPRVEQE